MNVAIQCHSTLIRVSPQSSECKAEGTKKHLSVFYTLVDDISILALIQAYVVQLQRASKGMGTAGLRSLVALFSLAQRQDQLQKYSEKSIHNIHVHTSLLWVVSPRGCLNPTFTYWY